MPTTRAQAAKRGDKRDVEQIPKQIPKQEPPQKKQKTESVHQAKRQFNRNVTGTIERGHIYFFYRPKVQLEEAHSIDDVKNFHMLLVPRPPEFSTHARKSPGSQKMDNEPDENAEMHVVSSGADAIPAPTTHNETKKHFRLITVGKKQLPDPESGGKGKGRKETFWATVTSVGDDLHKLQEGLGEKSYETKTRGTRHQESARLAARGAYAIVNNDPTKTPSSRTSHLGYTISHPQDPSSSPVAHALGIEQSSSFVLQIKNPLAPALAPPQQAHSKGAEYPDWIMRDVFGTGGEKGREKYGLRFASCEYAELLDYTGAQLLLIAARGGEEGLEASLGEGRGEALLKKEQEEGSQSSIKDVLRELDMDASNIPAEPIEGIWV